MLEGGGPAQEKDDIGEDGRFPQHPPAPLPVCMTPKHAVEATARLTRFRPARETVEDLRALLQARADPNITLPGDIHPLAKVMTFANSDRVVPMRDLLLQAGAVESDGDKERWASRRKADACEGAWLRNFHQDPR